MSDCSESAASAPAPPDLSAVAFAAVNVAFGSLGRVCMALDDAFRIRHLSDRARELLGESAPARLVGQPVEAVLGPELLGPGGPLREALLAGEKREGWRALLRSPTGGVRLLSVSAACLQHDPHGVCDPSARYLIVLRPDEEDDEAQADPAASGAGVIWRSEAMRTVVRLVRSLEHSDSTVLISGESGTGKEVVARMIHARSPRRRGPFVAVNAAALPGELLESELFGHVRGAFTGATRDRAGRFEAASDGTLFLDEVGDLPLHLQVKLLRVLQEHTYERVGDSEARHTRARIVAATHRDLRRAVAQGAFREDLYYRLRVIPIELAPLRARREDIEPLARLLLARVGARTGRALRLSPDVLRALLSHAWPGNVRELENALEYGATVCRGQTLRVEDLPPEVRAPALAPRAPAERAEAEPRPAPAPPSGARAQLEAVLEAHRWNRGAAAAALGLSRTTLWRRMRALGLAGGDGA